MSEERSEKPSKEPSEEAWKKYAGLVVYLESIQHRGRWLDANRKRKCRFTECFESGVIDSLSYKWIVRKASDKLIALESVCFPDHFLSAESCQVTYSAHPYEQNWALWHLKEAVSGGFSLCSSRNPDSRLVADDSGEARVTVGDTNSPQIRVYQPKVTEEKELISCFDNSKGTTPVKTKYTKKTGISRTQPTSTFVPISPELGAEIKNIFLAKMSLSSTWEQSSSTTWSSEVSTKINVTVRPGTIKKIYQLRGFYGPYTIAFNHFFFEDSRPQ